MIRINLLKAEKKEIEEKPALAEQEIKEKKRAAPKGNLIIFLFIIILAALAITQRRAINKEKDLLSAAEEEQKKLSNVMAKLEQVEFQKTLLEKKVSLISQLRAQQGIPVNIMNGLSRNLPEWIWLTETSYNKPKIQIKGRALSNNLIADYISNLEKNQSFESVSLISSTQRSQGGSQFLEFSLSANYILPPELQPKVPSAKEPKKTEKK